MNAHEHLLMGQHISPFRSSINILPNGRAILYGPLLLGNASAAGYSKLGAFVYRSFNPAKFLRAVCKTLSMTVNVKPSRR